MDFLIWSVRSLHVFAVVVWLGGLMYQGAVVHPVLKVEGKELSPVELHLLKRFQPFVWMCVWTILITGIALMLFSPRFVLLSYDDRWSVLLGMKQLTFLVMIFFSFGYARMLTRVRELVGAEREVGTVAREYYNRMVQFGRMNIGFGLTALLLAAGMP